MTGQETDGPDIIELCHSVQGWLATVNGIDRFILKPEVEDWIKQEAVECKVVLHDSSIGYFISFARHDDAVEFRLRFC